MNDWTVKNCNRKNIVRMCRESLNIALKLLDENEFEKAKHRIIEMIKNMDRLEKINGTKSKG